MLINFKRRRKKEERKIKKPALSTNKLITYKISPQPNVLSYLTLASIQTTVTGPLIILIANAYRELITFLDQNVNEI